MFMYCITTEKCPRLKLGNDNFFFFFLQWFGNRSPGVQNMNTVCNDWSIQRISPNGALRTELSYSIGELFEACFKIQTENVKIKVSQESWTNFKFPFASALPQSSLLKPFFGVKRRINEYCVYSNAPVLFRTWTNTCLYGIYNMY